MAISMTDAGIVFTGTNSPGQTYGSGVEYTLNDYEQGTWDPALTRSSSGPSVSYDGRAGAYCKIGNLVYISCGLRADTTSGGGGTWRIVNLPFAGSVVANKPLNVLGAYNYINNVDQTSSNGHICRWQLNDTDVFEEYSTTGSDTHNGGVLMKGFNGCYLTP